MIIKTPTILRAGEGGGGGGGGTASWRDSLPEDIRGDATISTIPDVATLTKSYISAQRMLGSRIPAPEQGWDQNQWNNFYDKAGRPTDAEKYTMPEVKMVDGVSLDGEKLKGLRSKIHGLGLSDRQFKGIMELYLNSVNEGATSESARIRRAQEEAMGALRQDWGDKFDTNLDVAKSVLKKFEADQSLMDYLESSRLGDNPQLLKFMYKIGAAMLEDTTRGGELGAGLNINDKNRALQEIERLKGDKEFMDAYGNAQNPGHDGAIKRWFNLHTIAYPGKSS